MFQEFHLIFEEQEEFTLDFEEVIKAGDYDIYSGPTEIIPSEETQTLLTEEKAVLTNIVVSPIPSNYGRIAWNGSRLRVF